MATIKTTYIIQSCPRCGKKLLKVAAGATLIGSPLITCKGCGRTYKTDLRQEWYDYERKAMVFVVPAILPIIMLIVGAVMENLALGVMAAIFGLIISLCFIAKDVYRIIMSKRRMRDAKYLEQLLQYNAITQREYEEFKKSAA